MSVQVEALAAPDHPPSGAAATVEKMSRWLLILLCASAVALFPISLAVRALQHYFP